MKVAEIRPDLLDLSRCYTCSIRNISLFSGMTDEDFSHIRLSIDEMEFPAGESLFRQGMDGKYLFTVKQGMVKLNRIRENGEQRIMRILRAGDIGGLETLVANQYKYDAIALDSVKACRIPVEVIHKLDRESPRLHQKLLEKWNNSLNEADEWMSELSCGPARARLARLLLKMRNPQQPDLSTLFSRDDIGSMLCMTMETASRTINAFQREGKITSLDSAGRFYQIDSNALEAEITNAD